jgi:hypothetical protein
MLPRILKRVTPEAVGRTDRACRAAAYPHALLEPAGPGARVLQPGSGPFSRLAWGVEDRLIDLTALDPMAGIFAELMQRSGYQYPVHPRPGSTDAVDSSFAEGAFDAVFTDCTLDDCRDAATGLGRLARVVRPRGRLIVEGVVLERTFHGSPGSTLHDIAFEAGRPVIRAPDASPAPIDGLPGLRVIEAEASSHDPGGEFRIVLEAAGHRIR